MNTPKQFLSRMLFLLLLLGFGQVATAACNSSFTSTPDSVGYGYQFTNTSTGTFTAVQWSFGDNTTSTFANPHHIYANAGYYMVSLTVWSNNGTCQSVSYDTVYVGGTQVTCLASYSYTQQNGQLYAYSTSTGATSGTSYTWTFGDGQTGYGSQVAHQYAANGTYNVCLTISDSAGNCNNTSCQTVVINNNVTCSATFQAFDSAGVFYYLPSSTGSNYDYYWVFGDGSTSTSMYPTHQYNNVGYYSVCLYIVDSNAGCWASWCDSVYNAGGSSATCNANFGYTKTNGTVNFTWLNPDPSLISYWTFGDGGSSYANNPSHFYSSNGTYTVCLNVYDSANTCSDQICKNVIITNSNPTCTASFTAVDSAGVTYFIPSPINQNLDYYWNFGDGSSSWSMFPTHQYAPGTYVACLMIIDSTQGCSATYCDTIVSGGGSGGTCSANYSWNITSGKTVHFTNSSTANTAAQYYWSFGDGSYSTSSSPYHTYANAGTYTVCLTIYTSNCADTVCKVVTIPQSPCNADFSSFTDSTGYTNFWPNNALGSGYSYSWNFGDGSTGTGMYPQHVYAAAGYYVVCLSVINQSVGCYAYNCDTIYVSNGNPPPCAASFQSIEDSVVANLVYFFNTSVGGATSYSWSFGDGTSSTNANPSHTYATSGVYLVCLTIYDSLSVCQSTYCDSVLVGNGTGNLCVPIFFTYTDSLNPNNGVLNFVLLNPCPNTTYVWTVNGSVSFTGQSQQFQFPTTGWYEVCVTATSPNGTFTTCDSVFANRNAATALNENNLIQQVSIAPNPVQDRAEISLSLSSSSELRLEVLSMEGRLLQEYSYQLSSGKHNISLNVDELNSGMYLLRVSSNKNQQLTRFVVQN